MPRPRLTLEQVKAKDKEDRDAKKLKMASNPPKRFGAAYANRVKALWSHKRNVRLSSTMRAGNPVAPETENFIWEILTAEIASASLWQSIGTREPLRCTYWDEILLGNGLVLRTSNDHIKIMDQVSVINQEYRNNDEWQDFISDMIVRYWLEFDPNYSTWTPIVVDDGVVSRGRVDVYDEFDTIRFQLIIDTKAYKLFGRHDLYVNMDMLADFNYQSVEIGDSSWFNYPVEKSIETMATGGFLADDRYNYTADSGEIYFESNDNIYDENNDGSNILFTIPDGPFNFRRNLPNAAFLPRAGFTSGYDAASSETSVTTSSNVSYNSQLWIISICALLVVFFMAMSSYKN